MRAKLFDVSTTYRFVKPIASKYAEEVFQLGIVISIRSEQSVSLSGPKKSQPPYSIDHISIKTKVYKRKESFRQVK